MKEYAKVATEQNDFVFITPEQKKLVQEFYTLDSYLYGKNQNEIIFCASEFEGIFPQKIGAN